MTIISSGHDTIEWRRLADLRRRIAPEFKSAIRDLKQKALPPREEQEAFAPYTYLARDLANDERASLVGDLSERQTHALLERLAAKLAELEGLEPVPGELPAVYTYFGQFVNHDISAPLGSIGGEFRQPDGTIGVVSGREPEALHKPDRLMSVEAVLASVVNQHHWPMRLHSLYDEGPFALDENGKTSALYEPGTALFKLGKTKELTEEELRSVFADEDLPRVKKETGAPDLVRDPARKMAIIADPRNDENLLISQLHLAIMLFHNRVVDRLRSASYAKSGPEALFGEARRLAILHYQWCIVHDYLAHLLDRDVYKRALTDEKAFPALEGVPMEFAAAVFRFGHSMVSEEYNFNENFWAEGPGDTADLGQLFDFTSKQEMSGLKSLPNHWVADWAMLTGENAAAVSKADRIDPYLVGLMHGLHGRPNARLSSIAGSNLWRGFHRRIPTGQKLAMAMGAAPLSPQEIVTAAADVPGLGELMRDNGLDIDTPAWLYVLCEARAKENGNRLGPMASMVVARTIFGLLRADIESVLRADGGKWHPDAARPLRTPAGKPVTDIKTFLQFAGVMK